jgi:hypothetical protein
MIIKGTIGALGVARRGACEAAKMLARLESWLLEMQRDEREADCARDVWPGMREPIGAAVGTPTVPGGWRIHRCRACGGGLLGEGACGHCGAEPTGFVITTRGAAVDAASRSLAGYDERPAHCVRCGFGSIEADSLCAYCWSAEHNRGGVPS